MVLKAWPWGAAALAGVLAILPFYQFNLRAGWLLSVLVTEYGHWLAPVSLLAALLARRCRRGFAGVVPAFALTGAAAVFALPTLNLFIYSARWAEQLTDAFGPAARAERPSFARLFVGLPREASVAVERGAIEFSPGLTLDLYPAIGSDSPAAPFVVVVHGGGWNSGDARQLAELNPHLARRGIAVAAVNYRLAPTHPWPAARDDVRAAVAYLKTHARELRLDPARWAILGRSAGGQLAEVVAFTARDPGLKGLITLYAPTDMNNAYAWGREDDILGSRPLVRDYMGGPPASLRAEYRAASPLELVSAAAPPTLILHGARDPLVWVRHSELLLGLLVLEKVKTALITVPWGTHGFDYNLHGPGGQALTSAVDAFLAATL